jgi:hypothetical protein
MRENRLKRRTGIYQNKKIQHNLNQLVRLIISHKGSWGNKKNDGGYNLLLSIVPTGPHCHHYCHAICWGKDESSNYSIEKI